MHGDVSQKIIRFLTSIWQRKERKQKEIKNKPSAKNKIGRKGEKAEAGEENRCGVGYLAGGWEE